MCHKTKFVERFASRNEKPEGIFYGLRLLSEVIVSNACHRQSLLVIAHRARSDRSGSLQILLYVTEEEAPDLDDDGNDLEDSETPGKKRKKERVKLNPQFMTGVSGAEAITDQPRLSDVQHKVQDMCEWKG